jgi:hypothetical protein
MRGIVPGLLGAWLFALAVPVYQFSVMMPSISIRVTCDPSWA